MEHNGVLFSKDNTSYMRTFPLIDCEWILFLTLMLRYAEFCKLNTV